MKNIWVQGELFPPPPPENASTGIPVPDDERFECGRPKDMGLCWMCEEL